MLSPFFTAFDAALFFLSWVRIWALSPYAVRLFIPGSWNLSFFGEPWGWRAPKYFGLDDWFRALFEFLMFSLISAILFYMRTRCASWYGPWTAYLFSILLCKKFTLLSYSSFSSVLMHSYCTYCNLFIPVPSTCLTGEPLGGDPRYPMVFCTSISYAFYLC